LKRALRKKYKGNQEVFDFVFIYLNTKLLIGRKQKYPDVGHSYNTINSRCRSGNKNEHSWVKIGDDKIWESKSVKLLGINIDNQLKLDSHVLEICLKANRKLSALARMSRFLSVDKKRTLFKAFFESQFKYCPLIWMFHGRVANNKINRLHERALRLVYNDYNSSFDDLLDKDKSVMVHHANIKLLAT